MLFDFIDIAYSFSVPILLILYFIAHQPYKKYINNIVAASNVLLIFYGWYLCKKLYDIVVFILSLDVKISENSQANIGFTELRILLLILLPYIFLVKKLSANKLLAACMLVLLQWNFFVEVYQSVILGSKQFNILFYSPYLVEFKILQYISLLVAVYALLWLFKKLPHQSNS